MLIANFVHKTWIYGSLDLKLSLITHNYLEWKSWRTHSVWLSETLAWISTGVGFRFAWYVCIVSKIAPKIRKLDGH